MLDPTVSSIFGVVVGELQAPIGGNACGGSGATALPSWALYCNEATGVCDQTDAHWHSQASTAYDFVASKGGPAAVR